MKKSKLFTFPNAFEWLKGLFMAVGTPLMYLLQEFVPTLDLHPIVQVAISALITYLIKTIITDSNGNILGDDNSARSNDKTIPETNDKTAK